MERTNYGRNMAYVQYLLHYMLHAGGKMYTVDDILALPDGERAELIDGEMFMMATPTWTHQQIIGWMFFEITQHIRNKKGKCNVCLSPFGVFIKKDNKNYVEPDISVICERDKLDDKGCHGAPDWVIEVVSPSSKTMDYQRKVALYREAGVREYWIIDYWQDKVTVYDFNNDREAALKATLESVMEAATYSWVDVVKSGILEGLNINFSELKRYLERQDS